jgi:hypothetical protein
MRQIVRLMRQAIASFDGLTKNGLTHDQAIKLTECWFERCERLGPKRVGLAAHKLDYWAQKVLSEIELKEDALYKRAVEKVAKSPPTIKRRKKRG